AVETAAETVGSQFLSLRQLPRPGNSLRRSGRPKKAFGALEKRVVSKGFSRRPEDRNALPKPLSVLSLNVFFGS
ncbi:MAG: hypothetical protein RKK15_06895, partial [Defluviicoccus sp.]|nr:hypothetical protein [Defluviicoccus sp.]